EECRQRRLRVREDRGNVFGRKSSRACAFARDGPQGETRADYRADEASLGGAFSPARELAHVAVLTSMNIAELCGLQWKHVNLTAQSAIVDGEAAPPMSIAVRRQWSTRRGGGAYHTLKKGSRRRNLPIDSELVRVLSRVASRGSFLAPEDPVFASST